MTPAPPRQTSSEDVIEASAAVRREWLRRVEAEYRSAAVTQHLGLWLIQIAAPPDLVSEALRIVSDEMAHAELSHAAFVAAGGEGAPALARETLCLPPPRGPLEHAVLRHGVEIYCLGETIAVRLFKRLRSGCTAPAARRALDRVLKDEVRHRDFGWLLLEWLLTTAIAAELRSILAGELPAMLLRLKHSYAGAVEAQTRLAVTDAPFAFDEADRAWGLMPASEYAEAYAETLERDFKPRFAGVGVALTA